MSNLINCGLAGALVFLGALSSGTISKESLIIAAVASGIVALTQFKQYWMDEECPPKIMNFINI